MADDLDTTVKIDASSAADVLAQRIASISLEAAPHLQVPSAEVPYPSAMVSAYPALISTPPAALAGSVDYAPAHISSYSSLTDAYRDAGGAGQSYADPAASGIAPSYGPNQYGPNYGVPGGAGMDDAEDAGEFFNSNIGPEFGPRPAFFSGAVSRMRGLGSKALANMTEDWNDPSGYGKLNYAYAGGSLLKSIGQDYADQNSGKYLTPEEKDTANAGLLPGVLGVAGVAVGSMIAPGVGSWVGGMVGAGVGSGLQGIIGANDERSQAGRQASEQFETATGGAAAAMERFTEQINTTSAAAKEMQSAIGTITGAGAGAGVGTLPGAAFMSGALGERFNPALSGFEGAIGSDPILRGLRSGVNAAGGHVSAGEYGDSAVALAAMGDWRGRNDALTLQQGSLTDPKYAQDANDADRAGGWGGVVDLFTNWHQVGRDVSAQWRHFHTNEQQYLPGADAARKAAADDSANVYGLYVGASSADEVAKTGISLADTRLQIGAATGQTDAQLTQSAQGIFSAAATGIPKLTQQAAGIDSYLDTHPNMDPTARLSLQRTRDTALTGAEGMEFEEAQTRRMLFGRGVDTEEASYGLTATRGRAGLTRELLSGRSYGQLQGAEDALLGAEAGNAAALRRFAENPINSPAERDRYLTQASAIDQGAEQERYSFKMAGYSQNLVGNDLQAQQASFGVTQAQIGGGPQDVYQARGRELEAYQAKIAELSSELQRGGMTVDDRIAKERELTTTRQQAAQESFSRNQSAMNDTYGLDSTLEGTAEVGLSRRIGRGGNAGAGNRALSLSLTDIADAEGHLAFDSQHYGGNRQLIADDQGRVARAQESREQLLDRTNEYNPGGTFTRKLMNDKTAFQVAMEAPYMDGSPEASPFTRGTALIGDIRRDEAGLTQNRARLQASGQWRDEDETRYTGQINSDRLEVASISQEQRTGFLRALPEFIGGSPGQGNLSGVLPTPGQSAFYNANPFVSGTFGRPNIGSDGEGHTAQPGGVAGAFLSASGVSASGMMSGHVGEAILSELKRLNSNVERSNAQVTRSAAMSSPSGYSQNSNLALNGYKANGGL